MSQWRCPKCNTSFSVTSWQELFGFKCPNCQEKWGADDMVRFPMSAGIVTRERWDVAVVHDYLEERQKRLNIMEALRNQMATPSEELLLKTLGQVKEALEENPIGLNLHEKRNLVVLIENALKEHMLMYKGLSLDLVEQQYQEERQQDMEDHTYHGGNDD